ncbi:hypothetical protein LTR36_006793 [Oleoguttula mirabilis]|uniref:aldehyde dehydrogenase (NAD(+)) n=1 Tax=Oleoguttula mirabilis TaxID=1507867 RepID=A0AAV9JBM6_9PEZI|nr:hypothetical protein LTR36_006793 [Oleoguttula mirabilis]
MAAPLAAGNTVIVKPSEQAPLSCLRLAEILSDVFSPGVLSVLPGGVECGKALSTHPLSCADPLKPTLLELEGKNALIACPDADIDKLVVGVAGGMNFTWPGQSCGSTSRVFLHKSIPDAVLKKVVEYVKRVYKAGVPTDFLTTMGPVISKAAHDRIMSYIKSAKQEGANLVCGGKAPEGIDGIKGGYFIELTIFSEVKLHIRIAKEEIFGPVIAVLK